MAPSPPPSDEAAVKGNWHDERFTRVRWDGAVHEFNREQAKCVALMWDAWERGLGPIRPGRFDELLRPHSRMHAVRFADVFRNPARRKSRLSSAMHGAWRTMIQGDGRAGFQLVSTARR